MGQSLVVNYLKTDTIFDPNDNIKFMRYPGEWLFPGGAVETNETINQAARRELMEEFLVNVNDTNNEHTKIRPFLASQTRKIKGKSNLMVNMIAMLNENTWLQNINIEDKNLELKQKRLHVEKLMKEGKWKSMTKEEREELSPEMYQLKWMKIEELVLIMQRSISIKSNVFYVNDYQRKEFAKYNIKVRSPLSVTMITVVQVEMKDRMNQLISNESFDKMIDDASFTFSNNIVALGKANHGVNGQSGDVESNSGNSRMSKM